MTPPKKIVIACCQRTAEASHWRVLVDGRREVFSGPADLTPDEAPTAFCYAAKIDDVNYRWQRIHTTFDGLPGPHIEGIRAPTQATLHRKLALWPRKIVCRTTLDGDAAVFGSNLFAVTIPYRTDLSLYTAAHEACQEHGIDYAMYNWSDGTDVVDKPEVVGNWRQVDLSVTELRALLELTQAWLYSKGLPDFIGLDNWNATTKLESLCHAGLVRLVQDGRTLSFHEAVAVVSPHTVTVSLTEILRLSSVEGATGERAALFGRIYALLPKTFKWRPPNGFTADVFAEWLVRSIAAGVIAPDGKAHHLTNGACAPGIPLELLLIGDQTARDLAHTRWAAGERAPVEILTILDEAVFQHAKRSHAAELNDQNPPTSNQP